MIFDQLDFGKHAFKPLNRVPAQYLQWLLREVSLTARFMSVIEAELSRRGQQAEGPASPAGGGGRRVPVDLAGLLRRVHRELTMQHHPDRGGCADVMKGVNLTIHRMKEVAGVG